MRKRRTEPHKVIMAKLTPTQRGIVALLRGELPLAYQCFSAAYHAPDWNTRDIAVAGLGDILDRRIAEYGKQPSVMIAAVWEPPQVLKRHKKPYVETDRMLILLDGFLQPALVQTRTIPEVRTVRALEATLALLEQILLNDPDYRVRFSALLVMSSMLGQERLHFIMESLQRAERQERNESLKYALQQIITAPPT